MPENKDEVVRTFNEGYSAGLAYARQEADRDFFAAAALTGLLANSSIREEIKKIANENKEPSKKTFALIAYEHADEMLKARKQ